MAGMSGRGPATLVESPTPRVSNRPTKNPRAARRVQKAASQATSCCEKPITRTTGGAPSFPNVSYSNSTPLVEARIDGKGSTESRAKPAPSRDGSRSSARSCSRARRRLILSSRHARFLFRQDASLGRLRLVLVLQARGALREVPASRAVAVLAEDPPRESAAYGRRGRRSRRRHRGPGHRRRDGAGPAREPAEQGAVPVPQMGADRVP